MERQISLINFEYILDRIFDRYDNEITEAIEAYQIDDTYIEQTHFGDYLLFQTDYIRLYAIHNENKDWFEYELEYKFEPFGTWQSVVKFND